MRDPGNEVEISTVMINMVKPHEPLHFGKEEILHFLLVLKYTYSDLKKKI